MARPDCDPRWIEELMERRSLSLIVDGLDKVELQRDDFIRSSLVVIIIVIITIVMSSLKK